MAGKRNTYLTREMLGGNVRHASLDIINQLELPDDASFSIDVAPDLPIRFASVADTPLDLPDLDFQSQAPGQELPPPDTFHTRPPEQELDFQSQVPGQEPLPPDTFRPKPPDQEFDQDWIEQTLDDAVGPSSDGFSFRDPSNVARHQRRLVDETLATRQAVVDNIDKQQQQNTLQHEIQFRMNRVLRCMAVDAGQDYRNIDFLMQSLEMHRNTITDSNH